MTEKPAWLPELILFEDYQGNWDKYLKAIYNIFVNDFVKSTPSYQGQKLALKKHPVIQGKEATFWHIISEGRIEEDRTPDFRRCERIRWPRPIIENSSDIVLKVWKNRRNYDTRILIWFESEEYLVVLTERKGYLLLWTAFMVTQEHRKRKLKKEFEAYQKAKAAQ